jgi:carbon storage regulator
MGDEISRIGRSIVMLILRRKIDEAVVLDGKIRVVVLAVDGGRVKIGIEAPRNITIVREELLSPELQEEQKTVCL